MSVSVLEGQLQVLQPDSLLLKGCNTVMLPQPGLRSAMLDFEELPGSLGNSSLLMTEAFHRISFNIAGSAGYIEIKRSGWTGFVYSCYVNDIALCEATQTVASNQDEVIFTTKIVETTFIEDSGSGDQVSWYVIETTRVEDNVKTTVHRRFKDFADVNSLVKQNFKGHHLRSSIPPLPAKTLKLTTDHRDPDFIQERRLKLQSYVVTLIAMPHVPHMTCVKAFLGLMDKVRETSILFRVPELGLSLIPATKPGSVSPAIVGTVLKPEVVPGIFAGDAISKINGMPVSGYSLQGVVARIKELPRPMIIHFLQVVASPSSATSGESPLPTFAGDEEEDEMVSAPSAGASPPGPATPRPLAAVAAPPVVSPYSAPKPVNTPSDSVFVFNNPAIKSPASLTPAQPITPVVVVSSAESTSGSPTKKGAENAFNGWEL